MEQILSALISVLMVVVQMITSFLGGGGITIPTFPGTDPGTIVEDTSDMIWPLKKSSYVSAGFPNYDDGSYHGGIDIVLTSGSSKGEPFYAVKDGKVAIALNDNEDNLGYGNCVCLSHTDGISTFYAHADSVKVKKGDTVRKGDLLGYIGQTGNATGPHLHLEVWKEKDNGIERVNPLDYIKNPYTNVPSTPTTPTTPTEPETKNGKFNFLVYGYGHGVGMSQDGAILIAKAGYQYSDILTRYYPGTTLKTDSSTPATVNKNGKKVSILEFLCKTVAQEIGSGSPLEALKAQAVATYTYAKVYGYGNGQGYKSDFKYSGTNVEKACLAVLGMSKTTDTPKATYLDYKGNPAQTFYFSNAACKTASSVNVWGGSEIEYLKGGVSSPETPVKSTKTYTAEEMKTLINDYAKAENKTITLDKDPSKWIEIVSHDGSLGTAGYIKEIKVGNIKMSGNTFRSKVLKYGLKSHCFLVGYDTVPKEIKITVEPIEAPKPASTPFVLPKASMITGVPFLDQNKLGYPMGCEAASAAMVMNYFGFDSVTIKDVVAATPKASKYFKQGNEWFGGDPFKGFVGDPTKKMADGAYGCFAPPLVTAMQSIAGKDRVYNISGCTADQLFTFVAKGCPVVVWCCNTDNKLSKDITWRIIDNNGKPTGDTFTMIKYEHCAVLVGYDENYVYLNNPSRTAGYKQDKNLFMSNWNMLYNQAVIMF